jgi:ferredoxin-NADP reductase/nitrite reductase/ring-hydroxylating ferredoxin subunit
MGEVLHWWHPVAAISDLRDRHIFQTELFGHELVVWRADDSFVNVWENRCLHRGSRLSGGVNDGTELVCAYHGWRYANQTAGCTYIPAHPADAPSRTVCNRVYPSLLQDGFVWAALELPGELPSSDLRHEGDPLVLRSLPIDVSFEEIQHHLEDHEFDIYLGPNSKNTGSELVPDDLSLFSYQNSTSHELFSLRLILQPFNTNKTIVHGLLSPAPEEQDRLASLLHYNTQFTKFREKVESNTFVTPDQHLGDIDRPTDGWRAVSLSNTNSIEVEVVKKWKTAVDIVGFEFHPLGVDLPTFQPGAHIDVHLANGLVRQYSLINGPGEQSHYQIGVKLEQNSRGGSKFLHEDVQQGDRLTISGPHNKFGLRRDAPRTVLFAGGIGVTPLLAMAQALNRSELDFALHYFAQSEDHLAFQDRLEQLGNRLLTHIGLGPEETTQTVASILGSYDYLSQVYSCGPPQMISAICDTAAGLGWPAKAVHYEYFTNDNNIDDSSAFEIHLARTGVTLSVNSGQTILEVLRVNGVLLDSSCEQGACGTCEVGVLDGVPAHQDVYLNASEHEAGNRIITCVSRALSTQLVLDI